MFMIAMAQQFLASSHIVLLFGEACPACFVQRATSSLLPARCTTNCLQQVAIGIGDLSWAGQCFRLAVALDPSHAEALNNLAVLDMRRGDAQQVTQ